MDTILTFNIVGAKTMLMHNGRLSNPLDYYTRQISLISKKRNKTDEDRAELASIEARGGLYETEDGYVGMPYENIWRSLYNAAKVFRLGEDLKKALISSDAVAPVLIGGKKVLCDKFFDLPGDRVLYRSVKIGQQRVMRARPQIDKGWKATASFTLLSDVLEPERLEPVVAYAGRLVGLGDWRPKYGTFEAEMIMGKSSKDEVPRKRERRKAA